MNAVETVESVRDEILKKCHSIERTVSCFDCPATNLCIIICKPIEYMSVRELKAIAKRLELFDLVSKLEEVEK